MLLYNTLTKSEEEFKPISNSKVGLYTCGPTVYSFAHIGNMVSYIYWDVLKRALRHDGFTVEHVMNITDVGHLFGDMDYGEDKVRFVAASQHKTLKEVAEFYMRQFLADEKRLNIIAPDVVRNASDEVKRVLELIDVLDSKGYLYKLDDGVYFDTSKFKGYGALTGMDFETLKESLKAGARVDRPKGMRNVTDFAVWRLAKSGETDMVWDSKYGRGFPGWHMECSAISTKYLGAHFDIHCGGIDHIQVHHTNEIAQSEAATGEKFVNYWLHNGFMTVDGRKMSKSVGNIYTLQELVDKGYSPLAYRYLVVSSHYRSGINFTFEALDNAENTLKRLYSLVENLFDMDKEGAADGEFRNRMHGFLTSFYKNLDDDLGTPEALKSFHEIANAANQRMGESKMTKADAQATLDALLEIDRSVLAIGLSERTYTVTATPEVEALVNERERLRKVRDFTAADAIRERIREEFGVELVDSKEGVKLRKARPID